MQRIRDLHDVSKHRRIVLSGGHLGSDRIEIFLRRDPKAPPVARLPGQPVTEDDLLGTIGERFAELFNSSAEAALKDTRNIPL